MYRGTTEKRQCSSFGPVKIKDSLLGFRSCICKKMKLAKTELRDEKSLSLEEVEVGDGYVSICEQRQNNIIMRQASDDPDYICIDKKDFGSGDLSISVSTELNLSSSLSLGDITTDSTNTSQNLPEITKNISICNICLLGSKDQIAATCKALFGFEPSNGLYLLSDGELCPILTDNLMSSFGTRGSNSPPPPVTHSYRSFNELLRNQFSSSFLCPLSQPLVVHIHQHVNGTDFPFCSVLEPQFYSLWKPTLFLSSSLKSLPDTQVTSPVHYFLSGKTQTKMDLLLQQANVVSTAQSSTPSQILFHLSDADQFHKETCFGDQALTGEVLESIGECLVSKLSKMFEENTNRSCSPKVLITNDLDSPPPVVDIINHKESLCWEWFSFTVYIKAYSLKYNVPVLSMKQFIEVADVFLTSLEDLPILISTLQSLQLVLKISESHIVIDPQWLFSSLGQLKSLSQTTRIDCPYLFNIDWKKDDDDAKSDSLRLLVHLLGTHSLLVNRSKLTEYFSTLFLPFHQSLEFPDNPQISPIYILTPLGSMPPGFFEKLIASLWMKSSTILKLSKCQCRSLAVFEMKLDKLGDYSVQLSNVHGYIKVSLATLYNVPVQYGSLCTVAGKIIGELKERISELLPPEINNQQVLSGFFECRDSRCSQVKGHLHLTRVLTSYLECMRKLYRTKLCDVDNSRSFWIATKATEHHEYFNIESSYLFPKATRPASIVSDNIVLDTITSNNIKIVAMQDSLSSDTEGGDSIISKYIESHYTHIVDHLDLGVKNHLYQSKILVSPDQLNAIAIAENNSQRSQAVKVILDAVTGAGFKGVMCLIAAIKADRGSDEKDDHYMLYELLTTDRVYATLKTCWIRTVIEQFCA